MTDYAKALDFALKCEDLAVKNKKDIEQALALDAIGTIYNDLGDKDKCSDYFFHELKISEKMNDQAGMAQALSRIGVLYTEMKNFAKALEYLNKSLEITRKQNNKVGISSNLNSIANVYAEQKDYSKALENYMESLRLAEEIGDLRRQGSNALSIGTTCLKMDNSVQALQYFMHALNIFHSLNNHLRIARCHIQLGEYYLEAGLLNTGIIYADSALEAGREHGFKDVAYNAADLLRRLHFAGNNLSAAYNYSLIESHWRDSLIHGEQQKTLMKLETQYQFEKEQNSRAIRQQRRDFIVIIVIIILL